MWIVSVAPGVAPAVTRPSRCRSTRAFDDKCLLTSSHSRKRWRTCCPARWMQQHLQVTAAAYGLNRAHAKEPQSRKTRSHNSTRHTTKTNRADWRRAVDWRQSVGGRRTCSSTRWCEIESPAPGTAERTPWLHIETLPSDATARVVKNAATVSSCWKTQQKQPPLKVRVRASLGARSALSFRCGPQRTRLHQHVQSGASTLED